MEQAGWQRAIAAGMAAVLTVGVACDAHEGSKARPITVADLTGLARERAVRLVDGLDLDVRIEEVDGRDMRPLASSPGIKLTGNLAGDVVTTQEPAAGVVVAPGAELTLFVSRATRLRRGERRFRLLTHCGLGLPMELEGRYWLPVNRKLRRTINAPEGFTSHGYFDVGRVRRVGRDSVVYTSSTGVAVQYQPTSRRPQGCE
jgi:hypothetical protein